MNVDEVLNSDATVVSVYAVVEACVNVSVVHYIYVIAVVYPSIRINMYVDLIIWGYGIRYGEGTDVITISFRETVHQQSFGGTVLDMVKETSCDEQLRLKAV